MAVRQTSTWQRSTDALDLLTQDHRSIDALFARYESLVSGDDRQEKRRVVQRISSQLRAHADLEETIFYPAVRELLAEGEALVDDSMQEHREVKELLAELEATDPGSTSYDARVMSLIGDVRHHVKEEENDMFPKLRTAVGQPQLEALGRRMREARGRRGPLRPTPAPDLVGALFGSPVTPPPAKRSPAKRSTAKKAPATRPAAKKSTAKRSPAKRSMAKKATATRPTSRKSTAKRSTAKRSTATSPRTTRTSRARTVYHVLPTDGGGWIVRAQGASRASSSHDGKQEAVARGRELAQRRRPSQLVVHAKNGTIQGESTYGQDPRRTKG